MNPCRVRPWFFSRKNRARILSGFFIHGRANTLCISHINEPLPCTTVVNNCGNTANSGVDMWKIQWTTCQLNVNLCGFLPFGVTGFPVSAQGPPGSSPRPGSPQQASRRLLRVVPQEARGPRNGARLPCIQQNAPSLLQK